MKKLIAVFMLLFVACPAFAASIYKMPPLKITYTDDQGLLHTVVNALGIGLTPYGTSRTIHGRIANRNVVNFIPVVAAKIPYKYIDPVEGLKTIYLDSPNFVATGCGELVLPGQSCYFDVTFTPAMPERIDGTIHTISEAFVIYVGGGTMAYVLEGFVQ